MLPPHTAHGGLAGVVLVVKKKKERKKKVGVRRTPLRRAQWSRRYLTNEEFGVRRER
jgi:hypothetical protein